jgi:hypothetical protein
VHAVFIRAEQRKVVIITALSLLVAVVCFDVLQSTGTFSNGALGLTGAFVGFIVTFGGAVPGWSLFIHAYQSDSHR